MIGTLVIAAAINLILVSRYVRYERETARLREGMTKAQRERADAVLTAERHRFRVELELIRRQARRDRQLHLAVNVDSSRMVLERDGVVLREMAVRVGPERFSGAHGDSAIQVSALGSARSSADSRRPTSSRFPRRPLPIAAFRFPATGRCAAHWETTR
jgi:hypothetical protein